MASTKSAKSAWEALCTIYPLITHQQPHEAPRAETTERAEIELSKTYEVRDFVRQLVREGGIKYALEVLDAHEKRISAQPASDKRSMQLLYCQKLREDITKIQAGAPSGPA